MSTSSAYFIAKRCRSGVSNAHGIAENVVYNLQGASICIHDDLETFFTNIVLLN